MDRKKGEIKPLFYVGNVLRSIALSCTSLSLSLSSTLYTILYFGILYFLLSLSARPGYSGIVLLSLCWCSFPFLFPFDAMAGAGHPCIEGGEDGREMIQRVTVGRPS